MNALRFWTWKIKSTHIWHTHSFVFVCLLFVWLCAKNTKSLNKAHDVQINGKTRILIKIESILSLPPSFRINFWKLMRLHEIYMWKYRWRICCILFLIVDAWDFSVLIDKSVCVFFACVSKILPTQQNNNLWQTAKGIYQIKPIHCCVYMGTFDGGEVTAAAAHVF